MSWSKKLLQAPIIGDVTKRVISKKANNEAENIAVHFTQFLQPEVALTDKLREEVFKIRHNVYCEELNFEPIRDNAKEEDEFDPLSLFALIKHRPSGNYTSCVRIVTSTKSDELLPIEKYCRESIEHKELDPVLFEREEICEFSRLAVKADFRRRRADKFSGSATASIEESSYSDTELRCFPFIAIGLYMAAASLALKAGKKHAFVMMEPRLARSMKFVGIKFIQLGKPVEYHGIRAPYYINAEIFFANLSPGFQHLFKSIEAEMDNQIHTE